MSSVGREITCATSFSYWLCYQRADQWYLVINYLYILFLLIATCFVLSVMTMESQAEALGQLGADDLEGKVNWVVRTNF